MAGGRWQGSSIQGAGWRVAGQFNTRGRVAGSRAVQYKGQGGAGGRAVQYKGQGGG